MAFNFLPAMAQMLPLNGLIRVTGKRIIFPFYHLVSDDEVPHIKHLYKVRTSREFIQDLDFLLKHYKPININDYLESLRTGKPLSGNCFLLSFDDGLREFHDVVAPILRQKGIPALCFLNSAFIDNKDLFYRYKASLLIDRLPQARDQEGVKNWFQKNGLPFTVDYRGLLKVTYKNRHLLDEFAEKAEVKFDEFLIKQRPYLDSEQISSLIQEGFAFGSHSIDHPEYRFLEETEQIRQTSESLRIIKETFGIREKLFCFPFTDFGVKKSFFDQVFNPLQPIADLTFGGAGLKNDSIQRNIQRIPFEGTSLAARQILGTEYHYYMIKAIFGKNIIRRD
jgi:peptidoglycan/xylan/chitin deacetylase (PgdA/CDA1 family)